MLQSIRDKRQGIAVRVFIVFIIAIFGLFGLDSIVGTFNSESSVALVNGIEIDEYQLDYETQKQTQELLANLGGEIDPNLIDQSLLRQSALNNLIQRELLSQAADNSGMRMASGFIDRRIAETTDFQVDGVFNDERAQLLLQSSGYTPSSYRATLENEGKLNQLLVAYTDTGFATQNEINNLATLTLQKRNLRYLMMTLEGQSGIEIDSSEIESYYRENEADFMLEEQVSLEYLEINKNDIFAEVNVSEAAVQAQYDAELVNYQNQVERRASHILIEASGEQSYSSAQAQAEELKSRIDDGESFEELAAEFSNDLGSALDGGDVGFTTGDSFDEAFELALKGLDVGAVSNPVTTDFGVHLVKLTEQSSIEIDSFEDSHERISRDLLSNEVDNIYLERVEELGNLSFESIDLEDPADIMGLTKHSVGLFGRSGGLGIAAETAVISAAFGSDVLLDSLNSELVSLGDSRSVIIRMVEHNLPQLKLLDEVNVEIEAILQTNQMQEQVLSIGETIISNLENNQNIDALLSAQGLNWNQVNDIQRSSRNINLELVEKAFSMTKPNSEEESVIAGFQLLGGEYVVVDLQSVIEGDLTEMSDTEAEGLKSYITQQSGADDFSAFMSNLEARSDIKR